MKFDRMRFKDLRQSRNLSLGQVGEKMGIPKQQVHDWEMGKHIPSVENIGKLGKALGVPGSFFLVEEEEI